MSVPATTEENSPERLIFKEAGTPDPYDLFGDDWVRLDYDPTAKTIGVDTYCPNELVLSLEQVDELIEWLKAVGRRMRE